MNQIDIKSLNIPHGHGLSFKKGVSDGLLEDNQHEESISETHLASYRRGISFGKDLKAEIAKHVKA